SAENAPARRLPGVETPQGRLPAPEGLDRVRPMSGSPIRLAASFPAVAVSFWMRELRAARDAGLAPSSAHAAAQEVRAHRGLRRADRRRARPQLLGGAQGDPGRARPDSVQPVLPRP